MTLWILLNSHKHSHASNNVLILGINIVISVNMKKLIPNILEVCLYFVEEVTINVGDNKLNH